MIDEINRITLLDNNVNPTSLEFSNEMTTLKIIAEMQSKINQVVESLNSWNKNAIEYTDEKTNKIISDFEKLKSDFESGMLVKDNSVGFEKLNGDLTKLIHGEVLSAILDNIQLVNFGLSEDGYFYAECNDNWKNVTFMTNEHGQLVLCVLDGENKTVYETNIDEKTIDDLYDIYNNLNDKVTINITDIANLTSTINDISNQVNENKTNIDNITQIQNDIATNEEIENIFNE